MSIDAFSLYFGQLEDPRQSAKVSYPLFDILFLTVCATISGANGWENIEDFAEAHQDWFLKKGLFTLGFPVHDTIARVISRLDPKAFEQCFIDWMQAVSSRTNGELITIDGKVLRGSYNRGERRSAIHIVSAFSSVNGIVLGQVKTDAKSNEITAIPELIKLLDIKGCLISIDAIACQTEIAKTIVDNGGDYLLAVKGNQAKLLTGIKEHLSIDFDATKLAFEQHHGRTEARGYHVFNSDSLSKTFPQWKGLKTIGIAMSYRLEKSGKESLDYRYYISSAELTEERFAGAVRNHWG